MALVIALESLRSTGVETHSVAAWALVILKETLIQRY